MLFLSKKQLSAGAKASLLAKSSAVGHKDNTERESEVCSKEPDKRQAERCAAGAAQHDSLPHSLASACFASGSWAASG